MNAEAIHLKRHKLTAADYHRMSEAGILAQDARAKDESGGNPIVVG